MNDGRPGFTDAALFALAERLRIAKVLTLDHRHFNTFRPEHVKSFDHLLPAE